MDEHRYAVIGAGPSGLSAARALQKAGIAFDGYEASRGVGGLWDIENPRSTMYESAHLISSRTTTEFAEFPMDSDADYPSHRTLIRYFRDFADHFGLTERFRFDTRVTASSGRTTAAGCCAPTAPTAPIEQRYDGVILANGTLAEPNVPAFRGEFTGEILHTSAYKTRDAAHRQARAHHRRRQLGLRHRGRRGAPRGIRRHERAPRLLLRPPLPVRPAQRHPEPGQAAARARSSSSSTRACCGRSPATRCASASRSPTTRSTSRTRSSTR